MEMSPQAPEFIALGYCSNDHLCRVPSIPIDHKVEIIEHQIQGGGPAADAAVAAARLGLRTMFLTSVGADAEGKRILADLETEGIDVSGIPVRPDCGSPFANCWVDAEGKRSVAWTHNGLRFLTAAELPYDRIARAKILHLDGHHPEAALAAAKHAKKHGVLVNFDAGTIRPGVEELVELADLLICSEYFARTFTGEQDLEKALRKLEKYRPRVLGVTMGCRGSMFLEHGEILEVPIFDLPVVDTTGAGDSFHAGFAVRYLTDRNIARCARFASAVSGIKCGKLGARAGLPTLAAVEAFLASHPE